ncbi:hypothetical protein N4G70_31950 [Streptomyces sp. ASQP_92]|uniref:hypothetical protein n=1 Tax=Streptomyces sp. ASQP_92 TaxID=2979116 RepID=UPI0021C116B1|nr:hypothetical protein [Streptomyces sp. ASQP_92]MCT9093448.1 hypothetical protein [Streptomyces sp. ASQP_92]
MLRTLLRALIRPRSILIRTSSRWLALPPIARDFLPEATAEEAVAYNRARKAAAITLYLFRAGRPASCRAHDIEAAATALGWVTVSAETRAAIRANLGVLYADSEIWRSSPAAQR